jgi:hypothetical protein
MALKTEGEAAYNGVRTVDDVAEAKRVTMVDDSGNTVTPGATTIADGADVTQGAKADSAAATDTGTFSIVALLKRLLQKLTAGVPVSGSATLYDGSQATSTTAAPLNGGTSQAVSEVLVTNRDAAIAMLVGSATSQSTPLPAGAYVVIPVDDLNKVYVKSASGTPTVSWLGRS